VPMGLCHSPRLDCVRALNARVKIKFYSLIIVKRDRFVFVDDFLHVN